MQPALKRFFTSQILEPDDRLIVLDPSEGHHLRKVLRLREGSSCVVFDRLGNEWSAVVAGFSSEGGAEVRLKSPIGGRCEKTYRLTVAQAIPQHGKMDFVVQKAAELEVDRLYPMITDRTIVRYAKKVEPRVMNRWVKIVQEARKQSRSRTHTQVLPPVTFEGILSETVDTEHAYLFHPSSEKSVLDVVVELRLELKKRPSPIDLTLLIGPEGGFSDREVKRAGEKGIGLVRLGHTILKADTAFLVSVGIFQAGLL